MIHSVLCDLAGTTIDCGCMAPVGVFIEVFARNGVRIDTATARGPMGTHKREHIRRLCALPKVAADWTAVHGKPSTDADIDRMYQLAEPLTIAIIGEHAALIPGFFEVAALIRSRGYKLGATTGYTRPMCEVLLPILGRRGWVPDAFACASDVPEGRPAPHMNWSVATRLGAPSAAACVVLGDTPVDMQAARNAGMWAVGVALTSNEAGLTWGEVQGLSDSEQATVRSRVASRLHAAGAHVVIDSVLDLPVLLAGSEAPWS